MDSIIKVLQINKLYYPWIGGVEKVVQDIAEGLRDKVDMKVLVCRDKGKKIDDNNNNVAVIKAGSFGIYNSMPISLSFPFLFNKLSKDRDILHFHMPFPLADISYLFTKPKGRIVISWHSDIIKQKFFLTLYKPFLKKFIKIVDKIIVASPQQIENSVFLKDLKEKCIVIPFGIDISQFQMDDRRKEEVRKIKNTYGDRIVLYVGRLVYYKGVEYLIKAMQDVNAKLIIIGKGPLENTLRQVVDNLNLNNKIIFLNNISDEQLKVFYHACDFFILPSIANSEAFGIVQVEAMACAKPVINTNLSSGVPWVSIHGETGITVQPENSHVLANAMNLLLNNANLREKYGENARRRAEKEFSKEVMLQRILAVYKNLIYGQ
jgi:rhamnosyl/mannosyltransferase